MIDVFRKSYAMPIIIVLVACLAYANTFTVPFQFDDDAYIVNNPVIRTFHFFLAPSQIADLTENSPTAVPPALRYAFMTRMLGYFTFAVNYHLDGLNVTGYHVVNLAIHILNGILVFLILRATLKICRISGKKAGEAFTEDFIAGIISLIFVSHPIQTQAVTYISQRFASLAAFFYLLSLYLYIRFSLSSSGRWRTAAYGGALISTILAMLTKEFTITLPVMLILYDMTFLQGSRRGRIRRLAPFAATLVIIPVLVFIQQGTLHDLDSTMRTITAADSSNISRSHYLLTQFRVLALYLRLLFVPVGQNIDHDIPVYTSLFEPSVFLSFLLVLILLATAVRLYIVSTRKPVVSEIRLAAFGIVWFFLTLSVESSIIPLGERAAEYRLYLPSIGLITSVASLALFAVRRYSRGGVLRPVFAYCICALVVVPLSIATLCRNNVWGSEISLWQDAARKSPALVRPHQNLGIYYGSQGRLEDAKRELMLALALEPMNFELHNNLGVVYKQMGAYDDAVREYTTVLRLSPGDVMAHYNLGNVYLAQGRVPEAIQEYEKTVELIPDYDEAHNNLGIAYQKGGHFDAAVREFDRALQLNPQNEHARKNRDETIRKASLQDQPHEGYKKNQ
jgi:tetratricopeptide (TPR) repeat protein